MNYKELLKNLGVDYLLVNSTNKYLLEYVPIAENSSNKVTDFTGDVGDTLISSDGKIYLFVDSRFHIQADLEVDKTKINVVKYVLGQKQDDEICLRVKPNSTIGVVASKVSQLRYEYLKALLDTINVSIKSLDSDFFDSVELIKSQKFEFLPISLSGKSFEEKIDEIGHNILITNSEELSYVCNIRSFENNYSVKVDGKLLILKDVAILFTDYLCDSNLTNIQIKPLNQFDSFISEQDDSISFDKSTITAKDYSLIKNPVYLKSPVKQIKSIKNETEINHMKYAFEMTDKAVMATRDFIENNDGLSEYDIATKLEENFREFVAKSLSFSSIVAINENSALAHYNKSAKDKILNDGDLVLIDCGAYYEGGLATDMTRVFVKGTPSELQRKVYTTVLKVFLNCFNLLVSEDMSGFDIDSLAHDTFDKCKIDGFEFSHGLGHGVGVCVHESPPNLSKNEIAKTTLVNNMVFTIEPGLYSEKYFGVRLENTCYLDNGVITSLAKMCYEKKLIDYSLLNEYEIGWLDNFQVI